MTPTHQIRLEHHPSRPIAVVRRLASQLPGVVPEACGLVWQTLRDQQIAGAGRHITVYLDGKINLEIGVELQTPFAGHGQVVPSATPAGHVAATTHFGPYPTLKTAHEAIRRWCHDNGHLLAGSNWEIYGHWQTDWDTDPSRIRTDVFYLLAN